MIVLGAFIRDFSRNSCTTLAMALLNQIVQCVTVELLSIKKRMSYVAGFGNTVVKILYASLANGINVKNKTMHT